jgi:ribosomal-protein-alanine N-acetyltransferase
MKRILETQRIYLRPFNTQDLSDLVKLMSNILVMRTTGFKSTKTQDQVEELLQRWSLNIHHPMGVWCARLKSDDSFIGWFMLKPTDLLHPELGFMLCEKKWNQGFATEVAQGILQYASDTLKLDGVMARACQTNKASISILNKVGMSYQNEEETSEAKKTYFYSIEFK